MLLSRCGRARVHKWAQGCPERYWLQVLLAYIKAMNKMMRAYSSDQAGEKETANDN